MARINSRRFDTSLICFLQGTAISPHQARYMSLKTPTLPEKLKKLGYSTHMIGKYVFKVWRENVHTSLVFLNIHCLLLFFAITFLWEIMVIYLFSLIKKNSLRKKNRENKVIAYLGRKFFIAHANKCWLTVLWKNIQGKKIVYMKKFPGFFFSSKFSYMDKMGKILVFNWWNINFHNEMCIFFFSIDEM